MGRKPLVRRTLPVWIVVTAVGILPVHAQDRAGGGQGASTTTPKADRGPTAQRPARRGALVAASRRSPVAAVLSRRVELVDWDEVPLESVVDWLTEQGPINVVVVWRALEAQGIDRDTPVTLLLRNARVGQVLSEALDQVSELGDVRYRGVGSTIKISTREEFNRKLYVRVYDVSDLIFQVPDFKGPSVDVAGEGGGGGGGMGGGGMGGGMGGGGMGGGGMGGGGMGGGGMGMQNPFSGGSEEQDDEGDSQSLEERMDAIVELIKNTIEPENWDENGGRNTIRAWNRMIIVRAPIEVHELIGGPFVLPQ